MALRRNNLGNPSMTQMDLFPKPAKTFDVPERTSYQPMEFCPRCGEPSEKVRPYWWSRDQGTRCDPCYDREIEAAKKRGEPYA